MNEQVDKDRDRTGAKTGEPVPTRSRRRRIVRFSGLVVGALIVIVYVAGGWLVSERIIDGFRIVPYVVEYDTDVLAVDSATITIGVSDESTVTADRDAVMGLRWEGGYGQIGAAVSVDDRTEVRPPHRRQRVEDLR